MQAKISHINILFLVLLLLGWLGSIDVKAQDQELSWHSFEEALALADSTDLPVMLDVWAPWCGWCRKMKQEIYPDLSSDLNKQFVLARLNRDNNEKIHQYKGEKLTSLRLAQKLGAESVPAIVFLNSNGDYLLHLSGFFQTTELQPVLRYISTGAYQHQTFQAFVKQTK